LRLERIEYYWGLFKKPDKAVGSEADTYYLCEAPKIPRRVAESFSKEGIAELEGEHELPGVGEPTEVDFLTFTVDGKKVTGRVLNRAITLLMREGEEPKRLHRFFEELLHSAGRI
jgi:hypothetical protein